jgi:hypothetical protein
MCRARVLLCLELHEFDRCYRDEEALTGRRKSGVAFEVRGFNGYRGVNLPAGLAVSDRRLGMLEAPPPWMKRVASRSDSRMRSRAGSRSGKQQGANKNKDPNSVLNVCPLDFHCRRYCLLGETFLVERKFVLAIRWYADTFS